MDEDLGTDNWGLRDLLGTPQALDTPWTAPVTEFPSKLNDQIDGMTTGAPLRSRDELAALGKKKLEEFRQRKLRKALEQQVGGEGKEGPDEQEHDQASNHRSRVATDEQAEGGRTLQHPVGAVSLVPETSPPDSTAFNPVESVAEPAIPPVQARSPEAWFAEREDPAVQSGAEAIPEGFFDAMPDPHENTAARGPTMAGALSEASTSFPPEVPKKVSFDARKFMVMVEQEAQAEASAFSERGDPGVVDPGGASSFVDNESPPAEPMSGAVETERERERERETVAEASLGTLADSQSEIQENRQTAPFLPSRQDNQGAKFQELQDHIDSLTTQNLDLSLCLSQQTSMVQRLTEENEGLVHKLNDASRLAEQSQEREKAHDKERELLGSQWREMERQLARREKENRDLTSKVKVLGVELLGLEEKLLRERNERLKLSALPEAGDRDASRKESEEMSKIVSREREEKLVLRERLGALEAAHQGVLVELAAERARAETAERAAKARAAAYPIPQSAMLSAEPMQAFIEREARGEAPPLDDARLPDEIRALLPIDSWIPSLDEEQKMQKDVVDAIGRLYDRIEQLKRDVKVGEEAGTVTETGTPAAWPGSGGPVRPPSPSSVPNIGEERP